MNQSRKQKIDSLLSWLNLTLSEEQAEVFYDETINILMAGGEGAAKSFTGGLKALLFSLTAPHSIKLGWVVGADFEDARKEMDYIIDWAEALGVLDRSGSTISSHSDQKCKLHITAPSGGDGEPINFYIESVSGHDPLKIGREEPDFIIGCEVSRWESELWRRCQGRLARKYPKSWGYFSGSFETSLGWFPEMYNLGQGPNDQDLVSYSIPSHANRFLYPGGVSDPAIIKLQNGMSPERFMARHMGKPSPPVDAVLPEFKNTYHVYPVRYEVGYPVYVFIDPGTHIYAVLFVQIVGVEVHVLDEVFMARATHEAVITATINNPLWQYIREGVIDVAGTQHHFGFGSPEEAWARDTRGALTLRAEYRKLNDTVERLRSVMAINPTTQRPRLLVDPKCRGLIAEFGGGKAPVDGSGLWRKDGSGKPSEKNCDSAKALGYGLLALYGTVRPGSSVNTALFSEQDEEEAYSYLETSGSSGSSLQDLLRRNSG
jgi:hypothetical protein